MIKNVEDKGLGGGGGGGGRGRDPQISSIYDPSQEPTLPSVAVVEDEDDDDDEYIDTDTGKVVKRPKPCCGCRTCDHRFALEMDEESSKVYREARFCKLSYTFISSWCMMLLFATVASAGIIAIGFLSKKLIAYQVVGIVLTIVFGSLLPVFIVFWICLRRRSREIRRQYRAEKNRNQVFKQQMGLPLLTDDEKALAKPAEYIPPQEPPVDPLKDVQFRD
ncbi:uncharacterized protein [Macrobrachium rosenbergii]|uniref:uncharacterized protein n=1 Tax=Macrobrachium rosenbergii TaxID=79674 RepID=UPI0034D58767